MDEAAGSWGAEPSPDGSEVVFISDRSGFPRAWVRRPSVKPPRGSCRPVSITSRRSPGHPTASGSRCSARPAGRRRVPGSGSCDRTAGDAHRVAGVRSGTANFGPWLRSGAVLPLSTSGRRPEETSSTLLDVHSGLTPAPGLRRALHGVGRPPRWSRRSGTGRRAGSSHRAWKSICDQRDDRGNRSRR